jgi:regulator of cell morphogenesis and NO signaling
MMSHEVQDTGALIEHILARYHAVHRQEVPELACGTWRALCAGTAKFADDLREHIRLENDVLLPGCGG